MGICQRLSENRKSKTILLFLLPFLAGAEDNATKLPEIVRAGDGLYRFGKVLIDRPAGTISFDGVSNQVNGLIEYGVVHENGKVHESLFRTSVRPQIVHASMLLLKLKPAGGFFENLWAEKPKVIDYSQHAVAIMVHWELNGTKYERSLEEMALNQKNDRPMGKNSLIFTGSRFIEGTFMAESSGSVLAVYADDNAILNSSDYDSKNDDVWYANKLKMPPLECPVTIRFHLPRKGLSPTVDK
jgi:hypothetical protein